MSGLGRASRQVLAGEPGDVPLDEIASAAQTLIVASLVAINAVGAGLVTLLLYGILPLPGGTTQNDVISPAVGIAATAAYSALATTIGTWRGLRIAAPVLALFRRQTPPDEASRGAILGLPLRLFVLEAQLWTAATLGFGALSLTASVAFAFEVAITTALGGLTTAAMAYLVSQRLLRGGVAVVLADAPPRVRETPGVEARSLTVWALGTAVPVIGAIILASFAIGTDISRDQLAGSVIALCGVALTVGLGATVIMARSIADPLKRLRDALADVSDGRLDVRVPVHDATELGYAAAGFNQMVGGLRERERLRDLFGRQVGEEVARQAFEAGVTLGGEEREAAALFVDVIGSTSFAADRSPAEVVAALNAFFEVVVAATLDRGGLVNKFAGDAALCVFGAPLESEDAAGCALSAARAMRDGLRGGVLDAAIGVSMGTVVAGNVGTRDRYEYTVIGDAVNEAARLTELAKDRPGRVVASAAAVAAASGQEADRWTLGEPVTLRGRSRATRLAEPAAPEGAGVTPGSRPSARSAPGRARRRRPAP